MKGIVMAMQREFVVNPQELIFKDNIDGNLLVTLPKERQLAVGQEVPEQDITLTLRSEDFDRLLPKIQGQNPYWLVYVNGPGKPIANIQH